MLKISAKFKICTNAVFSRLKHTSVNTDSIFQFTTEVSDSLNSGIPVVALESTIITHGMPYPENLKTAKAVENIIRENGATPATIGVMKGKICIGLDSDQLTELSSGKIPVTKISRRDLPFVLSKNLNGGTTVSATMLLANRVGIPIFVTGGIGGVHRNAEKSFDVSSDLTELGRTPITVVSSGVKSILDIAKTLEYLETQGVCVATFGENKNFPAFFTRDSGQKSPHSISTVKEAAKLIALSQQLGLENGILLAVPIPPEFEADGREVEIAIQKALQEAREASVEGKELTPFILKRVNELTLGKSLNANIELIKNNARIGSLVAVALNNINKKSSRESTDLSLLHHKKILTATSFSNPQDNTRPVVIGGSNVDFVISIKEEELKMNGASHSGEIRQVCGGVGRNICEALQRLGHNPIFLSAVGEDALASFITSRFSQPMNDILRTAEYPTATYSGILNKKGECLFGVGDMKIHEAISLDYICKYEDEIKRAPLVVMDGNISIDVMKHVLKICGENNIPVWYEPTDINKATKPFTTELWKHITYISPNYEELKSIHHHIEGIKSTNFTNQDDEKINIELTPLLKNCWNFAQVVIQYINIIVVTLGRRGIFVIRHGSPNDHFSTPKINIKRNDSIHAIHYPAFPVKDLRSVSGSGDCLAAAFMSGILRQKSYNYCITSSLNSASQSLASYNSVPSTLKIRDEIFQKIPQGVRFGL